MMNFAFISVLSLLISVQLCSAGQYSSAANQYPVEGQSEGPIQRQIVFSVEEQKPKLPEANIVIGVVSAPHHFEEREAVRASWVQLQSITDPKLNHLSLDEKQKIVIRFIIGNSHDDFTEASINSEVKKYNDIVRVPVLESYFNLTLKTGEFFKWAVSSYDFKWAFKCDDDSFVRIDKLLEVLTEAGTNSVYLGKIWTGTPTDTRIDKFTPFGEYGKFAAGAGYALSHDLASYIVRNYDLLHKWPMEDVAVGMWLSVINVNYIDNPHFHSLPEGCDRDMIVQNPANPQIMRQTFYHTTNGVPCHANPDPFDPSTKDVPDHVLLELGIPKTPPKVNNVKKNKKNHAVLMNAIQPQMLMQNDVEIGDMKIENEKEIQISSDDAAMSGMSPSDMNGNHPSETALSQMNNVMNPNIYEDSMNMNM